MTLWDQGGDVGVHPDVAKFIAQQKRIKARLKICSIKLIEGGKITTKCGKSNHPKDQATIWFSDMTCKECLAGIRNHDRAGI